MRLKCPARLWGKMLVMGCFLDAQHLQSSLESQHSLMRYIRLSKCSLEQQSFLVLSFGILIETKQTLLSSDVSPFNFSFRISDKSLCLSSELKDLIMSSKFLTRFTFIPFGRQQGKHFIQMLTRNFCSKGVFSSNGTLLHSSRFMPDERMAERNFCSCSFSFRRPIAWSFWQTYTLFSHLS